MTAFLINIMDFIKKYFTMPKIYVSDIVEILILAVIIYYLMLWLRTSKAWVLVKGLILLLVFMLVCSLFSLTTLTWIINRAMSVGIIAVVIVFQPELRHALEQLGRRNLVFSFLKLDSQEEEHFSDRTIDILVDAVFKMAKVKTGALIVIKQNYDLDQYIETGIRLEAKITSQILINIFEKNTPLHDGAVIIDNNEVTAATCYLPLSENGHVSKDLGTRHRAALGMSEVTDAVVIVVSEETGRVSLARDGSLNVDIDENTLRRELENIQGKLQVVEEKKSAKKKTEKKIKKNKTSGKVLKRKKEQVLKGNKQDEEGAVKTEDISNK